MTDNIESCILVVNTGSPAAPTRKALGPYLRTFLMDPRVIDIPLLWRWLLVNLIIVPFRAAKSAALYQRIWTKDGSPLVNETKKIAASLEQSLNGKNKVYSAMLIGEPNVATVIKGLASKGSKAITVLPMFPQFAEATYGSAVAGCQKAIKEAQGDLALNFVKPYATDPRFAKLWADHCRHHIAGQPHIVFSFHSLPLRQIHNAAKLYGHHCVLSEQCCLNPEENHCYRSQCLKLATAIAQCLSLGKEQWTIAFQSKLGKAEWLTPSTEDLLTQLGQNGCNDIAIACPSFPVEGLESLEEINIGGRETFLGAGGKSFQYIPCPNDQAEFIAYYADLVSETLKG